MTDIRTASTDNGARPGFARRLILKGLLAAVAIGLSGLRQIARAADAGKWPKDAFAQKTEDGAIKALYGKAAEVSDQVKLDAPEIAENGAVVPVSVSTALPNFTSISIVVAENPNPLAA